MIKKYTILIAFFLFVNVAFSQLVGTPANIIDDLGKLPFSLPSLKRSVTAPSKCDMDTVQYPYYKTSGWAFISVNKGRGLGQLYSAPRSLKLYGFSFYAVIATKPPSNRTMRMICNVYRAGLDSLPKGAPLRSDTVTIDTTFYPGTLSILEKHCTFKTPVTLDSAYILTIESDSANLTASILTNSFTNGDGDKENLNCGSISGTWYNGKNLNINGVPFNCDILLHPHVEYSLAADFTIKNQCYNLSDSVKFTNQLSNSMVGAKMYNSIIANNINNLFICNRWQTGNFTGTTYSVDHKVKYSQRQNYKIQLITMVYGYRMQYGCSDTTEKWLYYKPDLPQISGPSNACIGDTANFTVSNADTGTVYEWYKKQGDPTPFNKGKTYKKFPLTKSDTFYVRGNNHGCLTNYRMVILNVNAYPNTFTVKNDSICAGSKANLKGSTNVGNLEWFETDISTALLYTGAVYQTPVLTRDTFFWVQANNKGCIRKPRLKVNALVGSNFAPSAPVISNDTVICKATTSGLILNASAQSGLTIRWFDAASGSSAINTGSTYVFTPTIREVKTFYADAYNGVCGSTRVPVVITVEDFPNITKVVKDTICKGDSLILQAYVPFGLVTWYDAPTNGNLLYIGNRFASKATTTATYYLETSSDICKSTTRTALLGIVNTFPAVTKLWGDTICAKNKAMLKSKFTGPGTIHWFEYDTSTVELGSGKTFQTMVLNGAKSFYGLPEYAGCYGAKMTVAPLVKPIPFPGFSYEVYAHNQSVKVAPINAGTATLLWDFGDGKKSTAGTVTHFYSTPGNYTIKLTVTGTNGCRDTMVVNVLIAFGSLHTISDLPGLKLYPNPAKDELSAELKEISGKVQVKLYSMDGKLVRSAEMEIQDHVIKLDLNGLNVGVYTLMIEGYRTVLFVKE